MDRMQKQSLLIVLSSIEQQMASLRGLVMLGSEAETTHRSKTYNTASAGYASDDEEAQIEETIKQGAIDSQEQMLQAFVEKSTKGNPLDV